MSLIPFGDPGKMKVPFHHLDDPILRLMPHRRFGLKDQIGEGQEEKGAKQLNEEAVFLSFGFFVPRPGTIPRFCVPARESFPFRFLPSGAAAVVRTAFADRPNLSPPALPDSLAPFSHLCHPPPVAKLFLVINI